MGYKGKTKTAYIQTEVDVDLDDFEIDDVIEFIEDNGYTVLEGKSATNMNDLDARIWQLYQAWKLDGDDRLSFWNECHSFFSDYYNKVSV
jgi:hypothetical protein